MANRVRGNVYIVDSHQVATALPFDGKMNIQEIVFTANDSTGAFQISNATTGTDVLLSLKVVDPAGGTVSVTPNTTFDDVYIPTITAGTAWIYLR